MKNCLSKHTEWWWWIHSLIWMFWNHINKQTLAKKLFRMFVLSQGQADTNPASYTAGYISVSICPSIPWLRSAGPTLLAHNWRKRASDNVCLFKKKKKKAQKTEQRQRDGTVIYKQNLHHIFPSSSVLQRVRLRTDSIKLCSDSAHFSCRWTLPGDRSCRVGWMIHRVLALLQRLQISVTLSLNINEVRLWKQF